MQRENVYGLHCGQVTLGIFAFLVFCKVANPTSIVGFSSIDINSYMKAANRDKLAHKKHMKM